MKEMVYQVEPKREVLFSGEYKGYKFYIINLGTHPVAYVNVKKGHKYRYKNYGEIDINVHGGLSYSEKAINTGDKIKQGWFIGWDYAHAFDYTGYEMPFTMKLQTKTKKWTTKEIFEDTKSVIEQLIESEK